LRPRVAQTSCRHETDTERECYELRTHYSIRPESGVYRSCDARARSARRLGAGKKHQVLHRTTYHNHQRDGSERRTGGQWADWHHSVSTATGAYARRRCTRNRVPDPQFGSGIDRPVASRTQRRYESDLSRDHSYTRWRSARRLALRRRESAKSGCAAGANSGSLEPRAIGAAYQRPHASAQRRLRPDHFLTGRRRRELRHSQSRGRPA
jgi:hypothetical protein